MTVYRLTRSKYLNNDGFGARLYGGRWNHKGTPVIYCGATVSLCALEVLANSNGLPMDMVVIAAGIPDGSPFSTYTEADLPKDWNDSIPISATKDLGTSWAQLNRSLVMAVPSAIVPDENNYLINPHHVDFSLVRFSRPKPFVFDPRLK